MIKRLHHFAAALLAILAIAALADPISSVRAAPAERFEVTSLKAVRPTLVNTLAAVQKRDAAAAREAFEAYDSGWNGIEFYINTRSRPMYDLLEHQYQPKITKALEGASPDFAALVPEVQGMLAKFDELVAMVEKAAPLNPLYDDVARLRIVRAHLREVTPALKAGNLAKARKSFEAFEDGWFNIEDFVRAQSLDAYVAIETGMVQIEQALLLSDPPNVVAVTSLVGGVMSQYNAVVTEVQKQARSAQ